MPPLVPPAPHWPGARAGVLLAYFFNGLAMTTWMSRLPAFQQALHLDSGAVGTVLLAGALGTLVTVTVAGGLVMRLGATTTFVLATIGFVVAYAGMGFAAERSDFTLLLAAHVVHGAAFALTNVPMSTLAAAINRQHPRTIIPQFHASFSVGSVLGAGIGAAAAASSISLLPTMIALAVVALVVRSVVAYLVRHCSRDVRRESAPPVPENSGSAVQRIRASIGSVLAVWTEPHTLLIGIIVLAAALSEGAANSWVAVASVDSFALDDAAGAAVYGVFLAAVTLVRLVGGMLVDSWGASRVIRVSGIASVLGILLFSLGPTLQFAITGIVLWGAGAALAVPLGIAAAAQEPHRGPARIAAVTSVASLANIAGPPIIGSMGDLIGLRPALLGIIIVLAASILVARRALSPLKGQPL